MMLPLVPSLVLLGLLPSAAVAAGSPDAAEGCARIYNLTAAIECYGKVIDSFTSGTPPGRKAEVYRYRALLFVNDEKYREALSDYDAAARLASVPGARIICERGGVQEKLGKYDAALKDYRTCAAAGNPWAEARIGALLLRRGDLPGAVRALSGAIEKGEKYGYVYAQRAKAYRRAGDNLKAAADAEKAVEAGGDDAEILMLRVRTRLDTGNISGAREDLARLEKINGRSGENNVYWGMASYLDGDKAAAAKYFGSAAGGQGLSRESEIYLACYWWGIKQDARRTLGRLRKYMSPELFPGVPPALAVCLKGLPGLESVSPAHKGENDAAD